MIKYFPFTPSFDLKMGTVPIKTEESLVEIDNHYTEEIKLKRSLLSEDHIYYCNSLPESKRAQWDAVEILLPDLVKHYPEDFILKKNGLEWQLENRLLKESVMFTFGEDESLPLSPLDWIGRQIQEDLIILNPACEVVAGQLCFPSGWALNEKLGKQFIEVHAPLPSVTNPMIQAANKLLERLPPNKPVARNNWGFRLGNQLDLSSKHSINYRERIPKELTGISLSEFSEKIFLRVEHQTLTRLPQSNYILFTIHTYNSSLNEETTDEERAKTMLSFLKQTPSELIEYKVMSPFYDQLINYLAHSINS